MSDTGKKLPLQSDVAHLDEPAAGTRYTREGMREGLAAITRDPKHVRINRERLAQVAERLQTSLTSNWIAAYRNTDEHYQQSLPPLPDMHLSDLDLLQWSIVSSSQGYLIWQREPDGSVVPFTVHVEGTKYIGGSGLEACHARAIRRGRNVLDPNVLANYTMADIDDHFRDEVTGGVTLQFLEQRLKQFRAVGRVLLDEFDGHFINVLRRANRYLYRNDGQGFIQLLMTKFRDVFDDWPICKRPNVEAFGLYMKRTQRSFPPEIDRLLNFKDIEKVVVGADYYRPLWFIRTGIFEISDELKQKLRRRELIEPGSQMEQEYRAFTVEVCFELANRLGGWPSAAAPIVLETHAQPYLRCRRCRVGIPEEELPCPYRPVCKASHEDHELMECGWPLALTTAY